MFFGTFNPMHRTHLEIMRRAIAEPDPNRERIWRHFGACRLGFQQAAQAGPDALAAQVGGIGIAPGGNINYTSGHAVFEATHGTAPKYADKDVINPSSVMLSGVMMFDFLGWPEAARLIEHGLERTIQQKKVTYDFERLMEGATKVKTSEFAGYIIENMNPTAASTAAD